MGLPTRSMRAFGTTATVAVADVAALEEATLLLTYEIEDMDLAASRFRPDSEVMRLCEAHGEPVRVSPVLFDAILTAIAVADWTDGAVDPTVGRCVESIGYDWDFDLLAGRTGYDDELGAEDISPAPGWQSIEVDHERREISVAPGSLLDLGATAKALTADRAAATIARRTGCGALVSIGGDVAVAGEAPPGGWPVGIATSSATSPDKVDQVVSITSGGIASSGTVVRRWRRGDRMVHHIVDPWTGECAPECWHLVSIAAENCVKANAASTAAIVWGPSAMERLASYGVSGRFVSTHGTVTTIGGWPLKARKIDPRRAA
jgi:FAD:protein FMN transferase